MKGQGSSVSMATGLRNGQPENWGSISDKDRFFCFLQRRDRLRGLPSPFSMGTRVLFLLIKRQGCEANQATASNGEVTIAWRCISTPPHPFILAAVKLRDNLAFTFTEGVPNSFRFCSFHFPCNYAILLC
jgi:hypothetical protein